MKHTIDELMQWQMLPLSIKIRMTMNRIRLWIDEFGEGGVYVSFSGGKDSTVLLDIVRNMMGYKDIPAVFVDTGLEYPEIRDFVKTFDNVVWLKPKYTFKKVIEKYGYPFISKEVANCVKGAKKGQKSRIDKLQGNCKMKNGEPSKFNKTKWAFLLDAPFEVDSYCCDVFKKIPTQKYERQTKRKPILGQMASESRKRTDAWLHTGCNAFDAHRPQSNPMAFWTEQDVLLYIKTYNIPICSVYGDIVIDYQADGQVEGQMKLNDFAVDCELLDMGNPPLTTTGCKRTGCMFCGFGCYFDDDRRFENMKQTHPEIYDYIMRPKEEGGLNYKEVIDWINEHGNLNIRY